MYKRLQYIRVDYLTCLIKDPVDNAYIFSNLSQQMESPPIFQPQSPIHQMLYTFSPGYSWKAHPSDPLNFTSNLTSAFSFSDYPLSPSSQTSYSLHSMQNQPHLTLTTIYHTGLHSLCSKCHHILLSDPSTHSQHPFNHLLPSSQPLSTPCQN